MVLQTPLSRFDGVLKDLMVCCRTNSKVVRCSMSHTASDHADAWRQGLGFMAFGLGTCLMHATAPKQGEQRCLHGGLALATEAATRQGRQARLTRTHGIVV
jgi:hypothetical protein